jgi:hypothetical protein
VGKFLDGLADELTLYVKHSAWLNTSPETLEAERKAGVTSHPTRLETLKKIWVRGGKGRKEEDYEPDMPEVTGGEYIVGFLYEVGPAASGGMGMIPVDHREIESFQNNTGVELDAWQARMLRQLSREYVAEAHRATSRTAMPPWKESGLGPIIVDTRDAIRALVEL